MSMPLFTMVGTASTPCEKMIIPVNGSFIVIQNSFRSIVCVSTLLWVRFDWSCLLIFCWSLLQIIAMIRVVRPSVTGPPESASFFPYLPSDAHPASLSNGLLVSLRFWTLPVRVDERACGMERRGASLSPSSSSSSFPEAIRHPRWPFANVERSFPAPFHFLVESLKQYHWDGNVGSQTFPGI